MQYLSKAGSLPFPTCQLARHLLIVAFTSRSAFATSGCGASSSTSRNTFWIAKQQQQQQRTMSERSCDEAYIAGTSSVAFVTTPDKASAKKLAHGIIERKLAACVNIIPQIESIYMWEGKVNEDNEILMMIKTRTSRIDELSKYVRENHPYSVAEVISLPIQAGNPPYLNWISQTVPEKVEKKV